MPSDATSSGLFLNLMFADLIQAFGNMPDIRWMTIGNVLPGTLCTSQAILKQVGIVGVSITSLAIALHTFAVLVLHWKGPRNFTKYVIIGIWTFVFVDIGIGNLVHRNEVYYGKNGYWCWIVPKYEGAGIGTEYLWVWLAGFMMLILYGIMFAIIRRWINVAHGIHWKNQLPRNVLGTESDEDRKIKAVANSLLLYPAVYIFCVFPNSLSRWLYFTNGLKHPVPYEFSLFASSLYGLSGMLNLVVFLLTRPKVVMGHSLPSSLKDVAVSPIHRPRGNDSAFPLNSIQKGSIRSPDRDYGILSVDVENSGRHVSSKASTFDLQSPSRTMNRERSSYDLLGVNSLPSSPALPSTQHNRVSLEVLDIS